MQRREIQSRKERRLRRYDVKEKKEYYRSGQERSFCDYPLFYRAVKEADHYLNNDYCSDSGKKEKVVRMLRLLLLSVIFYCVIYQNHPSSEMLQSE